MTVVTVDQQINASPAKVWEVLANFPDVYRWNPAVEHSNALSEQTTGVDAGRRCDLFDGGFLEERIVEFDPDRRMVVEIFNTSLPLASNFVTFSVDPQGTGSRVTLSSNYRLKYGPIGMLMDVLMARRQARAGFADVLRGLKHHVETGEAVERVAHA